MLAIEGASIPWGESLRAVAVPETYFGLLCKESGNSYRVNRGRIVSQLDVQHLALWEGNRKRSFHEAVRNRDRVGEVGIGAHGIDQEKLISAERALLLSSVGAVNSFERRNTHNIHQGLP